MVHLCRLTCFINFTKGYLAVYLIHFHLKCTHAFKKIYHAKHAVRNHEKHIETSVWRIIWRIFSVEFIISHTKNGCWTLFESNKLTFFLLFFIYTIVLWYLNFLADLILLNEKKTSFLLLRIFYLGNYFAHATAFPQKKVLSF